VNRKYASEFFATFILIFAGTGAVVVNDVTGAVTHVGVALTFGLVVMALVYGFGDVSGAHINPAVTIGFWAARRFEGRFVLPYIASQLAGAFAASACLKVMFQGEKTGLGATLPFASWSQSFVLEVILTWILMFVILGVSTGAKEKGIMAGAAIGAVIAFEALFAGPISGASMNPARSLAPAVVSGQLEHAWVYIVAPITGAVLAIFTCRCVQEEGCCRAGQVCEKPTPFDPSTSSE
jgi:aquaporin Z